MNVSFVRSSQCRLQARAPLTMRKPAIGTQSLERFCKLLRLLRPYEKISARSEFEVDSISAHVVCLARRAAPYSVTSIIPEWPVGLYLDSNDVLQRNSLGRQVEREILNIQAV